MVAMVVQIANKLNCGLAMQIIKTNNGKKLVLVQTSVFKNEMLRVILLMAEMVE